MLRKVLTWVGIIVVALFVLHHPAHATSFVHQVIGALSQLANNL